MKDTRKQRDSITNARLIIAILITALGVLVTFVAILFIRLNNVVDDVKDEATCNTDWKAAYTTAQAPRLAKQLENLQSTRLFYDRFRDLLRNDGSELTPAQRAAATKKLDHALDDAYDQITAQIIAVQTFTYPSDPCGKDTSLGTPEPLPSTKEKDDATSSGEAPLGGSGPGGGGGADSDGNVGVDGRPSTGGHGNPGNGGGGGGNPGTGPLVPDDVSAVAQSVMCSIERPVRSVLRFPGCVAN